MSNPPNLSAFRAITKFVVELHSAFPNIKSIILYKHLIERTTVMHEVPISKHISAFTAFCKENAEAIEKRDLKSIKGTKISYSERVYIDLTEVFAMIKNDKDTANIVWQHLLAISAYVNPSSNATKILKESLAKGSKEEAFISNVMSKVEESIDPNAMNNPMTAVMSIMSSGILTDLINGMQAGMDDGSMDITKLTGALQGMMSSMGGNIDIAACGIVSASSNNEPDVSKLKIEEVEEIEEV